ncbi:FAD-dependent oxidoreductase [Phytohabitans kaempferiae]|uniref:FAD-dependent oxidoreductase n=1 Tax=Phytohabitans kaempferiae TaxID=1620943 RepID=A0ABV6LV22_9ACTN
MSERSVDGVVVVGSGAAGLAAALAAGRAGVPTTLIESGGFVGGNSAILPWLGFHSRRYQQVVDGIAGEIVAELRALGEASEITLDPVCGSAVSMNSHVYRCVAMRLLREAGVRVMLHTLLVDVVRAGDRVTGVVVQRKSGSELVAGDVFVDATGDGDLSALAGADWAKGRTADGRVQAPTLVFRVGGIDREQFVAGLMRADIGFRDLLADHPVALDRLRERLPTQQVIVLGGFAGLIKQATEAGELDVPASRVVGVKTHPPDELVAVTTKVAVFDPIDADSLSDAYADAYAQVMPLMNFFVKWLPGFKSARLLEIAPMLGIRESRRIMGDYVLTTDDVQAGRTFDDGVAVGAYHIDIHTPDGSWVDSRSVRPYDIPLRALTVRGVENLFVAGKCMSASHEAIGSTRVITTCMAQGQAVGTAAAHAVHNRVGIRDVPIGPLQAALLRGGAVLRATLPEPDPDLIERIGIID